MPDMRVRLHIVPFAGLYLLSACSPGPREPATRSAPTRSEQPTAKGAQDNAPESVPDEAPGLACAPGFGDCDHDADTGCEQALWTDAHCGHCGAACAEGKACRAGQCSEGVVEIAAGGSHTCARRADGSLACWGLGGVGQLGPPHGPARLQPEPVALTRRVRQVVTGRYFTCVRYADGSAACFGDGGLLGLDRPTPSAIPQAVVELDDAVLLSAAANHTCALRADGTLLCWGGNAGGQLGDGETLEFSMLPVIVAGVRDAVSVATGNAHTCAVLADRTARCWGLGRYGQLGDGFMEDRLSSVPVAGLADVSMMSGGEFHTCAVTRAGELYCWGHNRFGQLGDGSHDDRPAPYPVPLEGVAQVDAGERHTCALLHVGRVYCWGDNEAGQLGQGDQAERTLPTHVALPEPAAAVSAGESHTCVLSRTGAVYCFGLNDGQLGDGTTRSRSQPVAAIVAPTK